MYTTDSSCNPVGSKPCPFCSICFLFLLVNRWNGTLALMKKAYESSHEQHTRKAQKQIPTSLNWGSASVQKGWRFPVLLVSIYPYIYIYIYIIIIYIHISIYIHIFFASSPYVSGGLLQGSCQRSQRTLWCTVGGHVLQTKTRECSAAVHANGKLWKMSEDQ